MPRWPTLWHCSNWTRLSFASGAYVLTLRPAQALQHVASAVAFDAAVDLAHGELPFDSDEWSISGNENAPLGTAGARLDERGGWY